MPGADPGRDGAATVDRVVEAGVDDTIVRHIARAASIAAAAHVGQRTRSGELVLDHLARVAAAVDPSERATAWLHDLLERSDLSAEGLRERGLTQVELDALHLLTHSPSESYELYVLRIAHAPGKAGDLARDVKLADLDDHMDHPTLSGDPPYAWARRHIANAQQHPTVM
jgi:hypothetical protein